jgi:hypothetical protein
MWVAYGWPLRSANVQSRGIERCTSFSESVCQAVAPKQSFDWATCDRRNQVYRTGYFLSRRHGMMIAAADPIGDTLDG